MNEVLSSSDSERKDAIKQGNAIYAFQLSNTDGNVETWYLDLKEQGKVSKGSGGKPDGKERRSDILCFPLFGHLTVYYLSPLSHSLLQCHLCPMENGIQS
jgi:hypothetical protein